MRLSNPDLSCVQPFFSHPLSFHLSPQKFYLFDLQQKKFIHVERQSLRRLYINNNYCNYCLCGKSVVSGSAFINHLSTLESTYYCFLILSHENENDEKNQRRIDVLVRDFEKRQLKSSKIRANTNLDALRAASNVPVKSTDEVKKELDDSDEENIEIDESKLERDPSDASFGDRFMDSCPIKTSPMEDVKTLATKQIDQSIIPYGRNPLVAQLEGAIKRSYDELQNAVQQLQSNSCRPNLLESLVQEQTSLLLVKRVENYQTQDHHLSFAKKIDLSANDLNNLLSKYEISNRMRIDKAEVCLNLVMKDESGLNVEPSLASATYDAIGYGTSGALNSCNGGYNPTPQFDSSSIARSNLNSTAHSSSVYYDCPDSNRYESSNGTRHDASHLSSTANCSSNDSTTHRASRATTPQASQKSDHTVLSHYDLESPKASEPLAIEPVKPVKSLPQPIVKKSELDQSLAFITKPKLLNFKIPKKPQINSFGHFSCSPDNRNNDWSSSRSPHNSPHNGHSSYKSSSSSYYDRY